jgi:methionyl aminopeptidase
MIIIKTSNEIKLIREANRIAAVIIREIKDLIKPGVSTFELDQWAENRITELNAKPAFKGFRSGDRVFKATLCTSINNEVVHGIPSKERILKEGDIIGIDVGTIYKGFFGDTAYTYGVGEVSDQVADLMRVCKESLYKGIQSALVKNRVSDISKAVEGHVRKNGYEIVRELTGHGVGRYLHEEPQILNYFDGRKTARIKANMTFAIEPMITNGDYEVRTLNDDWTVVTADNSISTHYEHTIVTTANGPEILSRVE